MTPKEQEEFKTAISKLIDERIENVIFKLMNETTNGQTKEKNQDKVKTIPDLINEKNSLLKKEIIEDLTEKIQHIVDTQDDPDPYETLKKYSQQAMNQVKKDLVNAIENQKDGESDKEIQQAQDRANQIDSLLDRVIRIIEKEKKKDEERVEFTNPLYPTKRKFGFIPAFLRPSGYEQGARNWLGLLFTGIGLTVLARGIWDASEWLLSVQGSIVVGGIIVALTAWLERRKVFALFGQE